MQDLLLKFDSQEQAGLIGEQLGYTTRDPETGEFHTTQATLTLAICVIGVHYYPDGTTTEGPNGEQIPNLKADNQYWVMVRSLIDMPIPAEIEPFIVKRDFEDPTIPNQQWA
ncbi:hypothetical protein EBT25_06635 [bacterium]|nr:hypothetical protein [bacterium]